MYKGFSHRTESDLLLFHFITNVLILIIKQYMYCKYFYSHFSRWAILAQLLPKYLITKEVCSTSTTIVFPRIPYLVPALAQSFCMLHVAM